MLICLLAGGANLDDLRGAARFLRCKVGIFPSVINKYLGVGGIFGDYADVLIILKPVPTILAPSNWSFFASVFSVAFA